MRHEWGDLGYKLRSWHEWCCGLGFTCPQQASNDQEVNEWSHIKLRPPPLNASFLHQSTLLRISWHHGWRPNQRIDLKWTLTSYSMIPPSTPYKYFPKSALPHITRLERHVTQIVKSVSAVLIFVFEYEVLRKLDLQGEMFVTRQRMPIFLLSLQSKWLLLENIPY